VRVFLAGTSFSPGYGGPAFSVSRLALALTEAGVEVGLWAPDGSAAGTTLLPAKSAVQRMTGSEAEALDNFGKADILHDNGMWLPHNHGLARLAAALRIPRLVSTRGMLEPWAMNHKRLKKAAAWWLYQKRDLKLANCHHTTAKAEARNVRCLGLGVPVWVIPNGVDVPEGAPKIKDATKQKRQVKTALFLGRIYPVKGLPMLVEAWARVRPEGWILKIAGPDEAGHRIQVEKAVFAAGLSEVISFAGPVGGRAKRSAFFNADLFVLPSRSESFGMAVAEALAHGVPVLTTTSAPWPMLPERGCGWWVDPTVDGVTEGLRQATSRSSEALQDMGARGREFVAAEFGWGNVARKCILMYEAIVESYA
jgi:glycosyltransferase involved in cell wall biosynthesis